MKCAVLFTTTGRGITTDVQHTVLNALFCLQLQVVVSLLTCSILYEMRCSVYNYRSWYHYWRAAYCMKCAVLFTTTGRGITTDVQHTVWNALFCLQLQVVVSLLTCSILYEMRCSVYNYRSWYHYWRAAYCIKCAVLFTTTLTWYHYWRAALTVWKALFCNITPINVLTCSILLRCSVYNYSSWYHYWRAAYCIKCAVLLFTTTGRGITTDVQHTVRNALFCLQLQVVVSLLTCSILYEMRCSVYNYRSWYHYWRATYCMKCAVLFTTTGRNVSLLTCSILYEMRCSVYNYRSWYHYWRAAYCIKCAVLFTTSWHNSH